METLLCVNARFASFWLIVHMDPVNALFSLFFALAFSFGQWWCHHPSPRHLAFDLWAPRRLITTTTTTMVDYMLVFVLQKILSLSGQNILLLCHYAERKRIMDDRQFSSSSCCVWFLLLLSVCIQHASFMCMLRLFFSVFGEIQAPAIGLEYELQHVELFLMDPFGCRHSWNNAEEDGRRGGKDCFGLCGHLRP